MDYESEVTEATFLEEVIARSANQLVIVDFYATWCYPCRNLSSILEKLVPTYQGKVWVAKIDTDRESNLAVRYNIRSLPTVKMFINGKVVDTFVGMRGKQDVKDLIDAHVI